MSQLTNNVALVTGGGRGIGAAAALELARRGADVAITARSADQLATVADQIKQLGRRALALPIDLEQAAAAASLVDQTVRALGPIDILVNNAGVIGPFGATWEVDPDAWQRALMINLVAAFRLAHAVLPPMRERGFGRIINVSSGAARNPIERWGAYAASKAGLDALTRQLGIELGEGDVAVVSVYPGVVDTDMQTAIRAQPSAVIGATVAERFADYHSSGRLQSPDRPARLIAALAGPAGVQFHGRIADIYTDEGQQLIDEA